MTARRGRQRPISAWVEAWAVHTPNSEALSFGATSISYAELAGRVRSWVALLAAEHGVERGDRVAYLAQNRPEQIEILLACAHLGAILVPLNWRLTPSEHAYQLEDAEPLVVLHSADFGPHLAAVPTEVPMRCLDTNGAVVAHGLRAPAHRTVPAAVGTPEDPVLLVYTSGTTGFPKGAVLDQGALATTALNGVFAHDLTSADRVLTVLPLFHVGGLCIQTLAALYCGATVRIVAGFDPDAFFDEVRSWRPTHTLVVPAIMAVLLGHPCWRSADLSSLKGIMAGSSVVPPALIEGFHAAGIACGQVYGATETGPTATVLRLADAVERVGSCGKAAMHCEVRIVNGAGADVVAGERGEVVVRGPNVLREYWRNETATAEAFHPDGWFRTGDVGHVDVDGWLFIDDRSKDVVISGGENIYPAELEAILAECDAIAEAAVIGQPDQLWGEVAVAVVVVAPDALMDEATVRALFDGRLARYKHPREIVFTDSLPRNAMGKVQKFVLRDQISTRSGLEGEGPRR